MTTTLHWNRLLVTPEAPILEAIRVLDDTAAQICLVVDADRRLLGTVTDGDIRRGILRSVSLDGPVHKIMNASPVTADPSDTHDELLASMTGRLVRQLPIVQSDGTVVGLASIDDLLASDGSRPNWVVLMAGGQGRRLRPLTKDTPKPLLEVGDKPILETIMERFADQGFRRFYVSINYKAEMVREHLGDGRKWNAEIRYLDEDAPLGTAGSLRLIDEAGEHPMIVMNADLLTNVNFGALLDYHREHAATATMAVREYDFEVPFGVVDIDENYAVEIKEKPVHRFFVNAGIYVLEPDALARIPAEGPCDMPDMLNDLATEAGAVAVFPIREYWLDIGRSEDLERANSWSRDKTDNR